MLTKEVRDYYQNTKYGKIRPELKFALNIASGDIAIDCGCGAGSNIAHLRSEGYTVHAFDVDEQAIYLCNERFGGDSNVSLSIETFGDFNFPLSSLIVADASLFFCPASEFSVFFENMSNSLQPKGVFYGSFLGARDTMASPKFDSAKYWGDVLVFSEEQIRNAFSNFEIRKFIEHESDGLTVTGEAYHWHIFIVVAQRI